MRTSAKVGLVLTLMAASFLGGSWYRGQTASPAPAQAGRRIQYYACPMHPQFHSDRPGDCPSCGMRLEPVDSAQAALTSASRSTAVSPGAIQVSGESQQLLGVRTDTVKSARSTHVLRVPGRVTVDDQLLCRVVSPVDGWMRELGPNSAGAFVQKKQILGSYYAENFVAAQQSLLFALGTSDQLRRGDLVVGTDRPSANLNVQIAVDSLRNLGMDDLQIQELQKTKASAAQIYIYSPIKGFVIARNVSPGQRFDKGIELYRIADISHVWVIADVFEKDLELVKPGTMATIRSQGHEFRSRVSDVLPQIDPATRTFKVRFETDNPGNMLRPDMFVDVEMTVNLPAAVTVPVDAIVDSGLKRTVYVSKGDGSFEPRDVETGWRSGGQVEILKGLSEGEQIVVAGNFMLDSESRMRMPAQGASMPAAHSARKAAAAAIDPVCGMDADPVKPAGTSQYKGKTYYFCSDYCKKKFDGHPEEYIESSGK